MSEIDRERYARELSKPKPNGQEQLDLFKGFVENTPEPYTNLFEFFDSVPKFILTQQTSLLKKGPLEIQKFEFNWGDNKCSVSIAPVVVESFNGSSKETVRKEILPGPREETIYRVLKKMAADPSVERRAKEKTVVLRFSLHQLRMRLKEVGHEYKIWEIREALEVLNRSPLNVTNLTTRRKLYSGPYLGVSYFSDETDPTGQCSRVEVSFNDLAVAAVTAQLYDRIHYQRLMSLSSLAAWIYERMTMYFRQAGAVHGYHLSFEKIMAESGLPPRKSMRMNIRFIRQALNELVDKGVLATFPPVKEDVVLGTASRKGGRRPIKDVVWTMFPHEDVVRDIRADNADQMRRRQLALVAAGR